MSRHHSEQSSGNQLVRSALYPHDTEYKYKHMNIHDLSLK